ncbi:MerR family transcriptional regulator [Nocardia sp. NPDC024068]|uniref:MerR family transcriptional regulator n=1 Tax=Nocardia sp. NPDC024068 TaxID=3157197 RepID=UPI00340F2D18
MTGAGVGVDAEAGRTVSAVARSLGIPVATLRSWNQRYGLGPAPRRPGQHRQYTAGDIAALRRMVELVRAGATPVSAAEAARAAADPAPLLGDLSAVLGAAGRLDYPELLSLITAHVAHLGVVTTWNGLCRPVFADLVARQEKGHGLIDVEHVFSAAITTALHRTVPPVRNTRGGAPVLLACTAGETHVLPLEVLRAALAEHAIPALLLGAAVPATALAEAMTAQPRDPIVVLWSQTRGTAAESVPAQTRASALLLLAGPGWTDAPHPAGTRVHTLEAALHRIGGAVRATRAPGRRKPPGPPKSGGTG